VFRKVVGKSEKKHQSRILVRVKALTLHANTHPIVHLHLVSPDRFMEFIFQSENPKKAREFLSQSSYGNKRSALLYMYCIHNGVGYSTKMKTKLTDMMKCFFQQIMQHPIGTSGTTSTTTYLREKK
jgi:hypothetical protein